MSDEFYTRPMLRVQDVGRSITYYCEKLGFRKSWVSGDENPTIAQVDRNGLDVMLCSESIAPRAGVPSVLSMSLHEPGKLGALYQELQDRGAEISCAPFEVLWQEGVHQFDVQDLDGNVLIFWGSKPE